MNSKRINFKSLKIGFLVVSVLFFLVFAVPLYSRPKVELSLSNVHPAYHEWYKRYNLNLTVNPSDRFGLRVRLGSLDFEYKDFAINSYSYGYPYGYPFNRVDALLYFPNNNVSFYALLGLSAYYNGGSSYYEEFSSFYLYSSVGLGIDWYFSNRLACFVEIDDFLMFAFSRYRGETYADFDGNPGIIFGLKLNVY